MSQITSRSRVLALGAICAAAGAGAGTIAAAGAATPHGSTTSSAAKAGTASSSSAKSRSAVRGHAGARRGGIMRLARRTVHAQLVIHTPKGFRTVTIDRGTVDAVSGDTLTMTDGTPKASDQKVTITVPAGARVRNDRKPAALSSLTAGERVVVVQLPRRTVVHAHAARK